MKCLACRVLEVALASALILGIVAVAWSLNRDIPDPFAPDHEAETVTEVVPAHEGFHDRYRGPTWTVNDRVWQMTIAAAH